MQKAEGELKPGEAPAWIFESAGAAGEDAPSKTTAANTAASDESKEVTVTPSPKPTTQNAQGQPEDGGVGAEAAKHLHAQEAVEWTAKGNAHFNEGALDAAIEAYNKAIQMDAKDGVPYSNLALAYVTQGKFAEAILLYQKSIELLDSARDQALSWNGLGNAYRCIDDYGSAVTAYQRAAELDPDTGGIRDQADDFQPRAPQRSAKGWNDLGVLLLKTGALDKAAEAFQKATELEPTFGRAYSNLARAKAAEGRYDEAVPLYEKGISLLETNKEKADAWNGLGNAYRKLNDYDKAINAYRKAVVLADEGVDLLTRTRFSLLSNIFVNQ
jgi:superkiller protein 3